MSRVWVSESRFIVTYPFFVKVNIAIRCRLVVISPMLYWHSKFARRAWYLDGLFLILNMVLP